MKISKNWLRIAEIYKIFCSQKRIKWLEEGGYEIIDYVFPGFDFSEEAKEALYIFESRGQGKVNDGSGVFSSADKINGYAYGKRMMDITVAMWKQDIGKLLFLSELYNDGKYPHWWLDSVFGSNKEQAEKDVILQTANLERISNVRRKRGFREKRENTGRVKSREIEALSG